MNYRLDFADVRIIEDAIVETRTDHGIELNEQMIEEFHRFIGMKMNRPCGILIDRKNSYSHSFEAMKKIGEPSGIRAIAILAYSEASVKIAEYMKSFPNRSDIEVFTSRPKALEWLRGRLEGKSEFAGSGST